MRLPRSIARLDMPRRAPVLALLVLYAYVGFHALSGSQGLVRWMDSRDRVDVLTAELERVRERRAVLQAEVDGLSARSLDVDALDVEARRMLFVAKPGELTIWLDP